MVSIDYLRQQEEKIICIGSYPAIIQSILDFDFIAGKSEPSIMAIIAGGRGSESYFFGKREVRIPVFTHASDIDDLIKKTATLFLNLSSGRRVFDSTVDILQEVPYLLGGVIFAEDVPEKHAIDLYNHVTRFEKFIIGPASVGLLIPKVVKLGAIGGVDPRQLIDSRVFTPGNTAVFSASGGMTNELIRIVAQSNNRLSFALAFGGDRFPVITPQDAFLLAQDDPNTEKIVYFGELGGIDEYEIATLLREGKITKKVICYIAGVVSNLFETPPQFGHAKAMAASDKESAREKRKTLQEAGALVASSFTEFVAMIKEGGNAMHDENHEEKLEHIQNRTTTLFTSSISGDENDVVKVLGEDLLSFAQNHSFAYSVASLFLGKKIQSKELENAVDFILRLLVDHGPYVSGAVNTMITARAGRDLPSALSAGLLTIGPRFGGAVNEAALNWLNGVWSNHDAHTYVENFAKKKEYIAGIGHKKYRIDLPDPRVEKLLEFTKDLENKRFTTFAKEVESVTTKKKGNLILNVDGVIAAVILDILSEKEGMSDTQLEQLAKNEFFNALFILSRSVGFIAHFLDQKRLGEGLFRLSEKDILLLDNE